LNYIIIIIVITAFK